MDFSIKKLLWDECVKLQGRVIENARAAMDETQQSANEYGQPKDRYDSYRAQLLRKRDLYAAQLDKALKEMDVLHKIDITFPKEKVGLGAIVITNKQKIFVSIGLGKVSAGGHDFFAISPMVPLFSVMNGLKKGNSFSFNQNNFSIIDIF